MGMHSTHGCLVVEIDRKVDIVVMVVSVLMVVGVLTVVIVVIQ